MECYMQVVIKITFTPDMLCNDNLLLLQDKYNNTILRDIYIKHVDSIVEKQGGRILHNGQIQYNFTTECYVINPCINKVYNLQITSINKMGALHKHELVTVFIPIQYYNDVVPEVGMYFSVEIIGKRIEDSIVCVGKIIQ